MYLSGKRMLVFGVASEESIAWHVALALKQTGAYVVAVHQMRYRSRVLQALKAVADDLRPDKVLVCDVTSTAELDQAMREATLDGPIDGVIHSIAFAPPESFGKQVSELESKDFSQAMEASAWSLLAVAHAVAPYLASKASITTMTYLGSTRVVPGYKLMGIAKAALEACVRELAAELGPRGVRVNAISAGPIRTLSARAVPNFELLLERFAEVAPLRSTVDPAAVGDLAVFLASDAARAITGQVIFADNGFGIVGVSLPPE